MFLKGRLANLLLHLMALLPSRHHAARRAVVALAVAVALVAGAPPPPGAAAPGTPVVPVAPVQAGPDVAPTTISPDLAGVAVDSAGFRAATAALAETTDASRRPAPPGPAPRGNWPPSPRGRSS
jgi:hypothetical protein